MDWSFNPKPDLPEEKVVPFDVRKFHSFPATFPPEIPFTLIETLTLPESIVYDPFAGIGTTYFQALLLNRIPYANEICEVSIRYMKDLLNLFDPRLDFNNLENRILNETDQFNENIDYRNQIPNKISKKMSPWYSKDDFNEISFLIKKVRKLDNEDQKKAAMEITLLELVKNVCSQKRGWGCIADNMIPEDDQKKRRYALDRFGNLISNLLSYLEDHLKVRNGKYIDLYDEVLGKETIIHGDIKDPSNQPQDPVDLVATSPPYPEMTDYVASQRLSYYLMGKEIGLSKGNEDMNKEIGARRKRGRKSSLTDYVKNMKKATRNINSRVKEGGYVCFVLPYFDNGNKKKKAHVNRVIEYLEENLSSVTEFVRNLPTKRRAHNMKWSSLDKEKIFIFRREVS